MGTPLSAVHARATAAARRNGSTGELSELEPPDNAPTPTDWWRKYFKLEALTVAGRSIEKGLVLTPTMGLTIVLALSGIVGTMYYRMSDQIKAKDEAYQQQRDMLIEIKTELKIFKEHELEYRQEQKAINGETQAWQQVTNKDVAQLKERRR